MVPVRMAWLGPMVWSWMQTQCVQTMLSGARPDSDEVLSKPILPIWKPCNPELGLAWWILSCRQWRLSNPVASVPDTTLTMEIWYRHTYMYEKGIIKTKTKQLYSEKITFLLISNKYLRYLAPRSFPFEILRPYVPQVRIHRYRYKSIPTYIPYRAVPYMGMMCWYYSVTRNSPARFEEGLLIWI